MLPRMSALISEGEGQRFHELIGRSFMVITMFSIPMIACSIALAPQMIFILAGAGYEGAILPMRIIMPAILFVGIAQSVGYSGSNSYEERQDTVESFCYRCFSCFISKLNPLAELI